MTWAKVDDGFWCHPKVTGLPLEAIGVWTLALSWCANNLTDGAIPRALAKRMDWPPAAVDELVAEGLWDETDRGWSVHNYLRFNPSKEEVSALRDSGRKRASQSRDRRGKTSTYSSAERSQNVRPPPGVRPPPDPDPRSEEELRKNLELSSLLKNASEHTRDSDLPLPEPGSWKPTPEEPPKRDYAARLWFVYEQVLGVQSGGMQMPRKQYPACEAIAARVKAEARQTGIGFDKAAERLLRAWKADKWVSEHRPRLQHLADAPDQWLPSFAATQTPAPAFSHEPPPLTLKVVKNEPDFDFNEVLAEAKRVLG